MKTIRELFIVALVVIIFSVIGFAQTPRDQLSQMVEQLQKKPDDKALREKIIKLGAEMKPAPVISEEAMRRMARGKAAYKSAKSIEDYQDAIKEYQLAIEQAPWWVDAYFNLGVVQDKAEKYADALQSLKFALISTPEDKEIKNLIYEVEYRNEKANSPKAKADLEKAVAGKQREETIKRFVGSWYHDYSLSGQPRQVWFHVKYGSDEKLKIVITSNNQFEELDNGFSDIEVVLDEIRWKRIEKSLDNHICASYQTSAKVSSDGNSLTITNTLLPFESAQWNSCPYQHSYSSYSNKYKKRN